MQAATHAQRAADGVVLDELVGRGVGEAVGDVGAGGVVGGVERRVGDPVACWGGGGLLVRCDGTGVRGVDGVEESEEEGEGRRVRW